MEENKPLQEQDKLIKRIIDTISRAKSTTSIGKFNEVMNSFYSKIQRTSLSIIQKFSIMFYSCYNHLTPKCQNKNIKTLIELSNFMINNLKTGNILSSLESEIKKYVPKEFNNYKIFDENKKNKDSFELIFSICLLSRNIKLMKKFFSEYLNVKLFEDDDYDLIDLENPFSSGLFDSIFNDVYIAIKNGQRGNIKSIAKKCLDDANISLNKLFHCNKCYDFMIMKFDEKDIFKVKCMNCPGKFKEYNYDEYKTIFKCSECDNNIIFHNSNYKCTSCKKLVCSKCKNMHCNNCFSLRFIKLYEVGFKCETHNRKYIYYCSVCQKSICEFCKEIHPHIIQNPIDISKKVIELFDNLKLLKDIDAQKSNFIKYKLCFSYINDIKFNRFNGFLYEILCQIIKIDLKKKNEDILFKKFNNDEFKKYYYKLINDASNGNIYAINSLDSIKSYYKKKNIIEIRIQHNKIFNNEYYIRNFIENCHSIWFKLAYIHIKINFDNIKNDLNLSINNLKIENAEINTKLLIKDFSSKIYEGNTNYILSRFFANKLLQQIVTKYPAKLSQIPLSLSIFIDLFNQKDSSIILNEEIRNSIIDILENINSTLKEFKNASDDSAQNNLKEKLVQYLKPFNKIYFIEDIVIGQDTFTKEELNQVLEIFLFIIRKGNITAYPNIDLNESLKMISLPTMPLKFEIDYFYNNLLSGKIETKMNKKFENTENMYDDKLPTLINDDEDYYYYKLNNLNIKQEEKYNLYKNIKDYKDGVMDDINNKIKEIRDDILSRLNISNIKKDVQTKDIIEAIFEDKYNNILKEVNEIQRVIFCDTDDVIKKYLNLDLDKKLSEENNNINEFLKIIKRMRSILKNFFYLNVPIHSNIEIYINNIIENNIYDYSSIDEEIRDLELKIMKELNIELDCDKSEIIAEAYFLLFVKTYENEMKRLNCIKKNLEKGIIKTIIYEEIGEKLKEIHQKLEEKYSTNTEGLTKLISNKFFSDKNSDKLTYERMKYILIKILDENISLDESKDSKLSVDSKLYNIQNSKIQ